MEHPYQSAVTKLGGNIFHGHSLLMKVHVLWNSRQSMQLFAPSVANVCYTSIKTTMMQTSIKQAKKYRAARTGVSCVDMRPAAL